MHRRLALAALALIVVTALGCGGGGGSDDAEKVVREFADAISESDTEKLCNDLLSKEGREQLTGATGGDSDDKCEQELGKLQGGRKIEVTRIISKKVEGDRATVIAEIDEGRSSRRQVFKLKKEDGDFRMAPLQ